MPRYIFYTFYYKLIITKSGDVHKNPGPRSVNNTVSEICLSYLDVRSILAPVKDGITKLAEISTLASSHSIDIFGVGETWLDQSIADEDLRIPGFQLPYRRDRNRHGGGVAVFISETLSAYRCPQFEPDGLQFICISVKTNSNNFILICYYYNPPNSNMDTFLNGFQSVVAAASVDNFSGVFLIGDTKAKHKDWCDKDESCLRGRILQSFMLSNSLNQIITEPTRFGKNTSSCIDHIFTDSGHIVVKHGILPHNNISEHSPIFSQLKVKCNKNTAFNRIVWNYSKGNFDLFRQFLYSTRWDSVFCKSNVNDATRDFMDILNLLAEHCIPKYSVTIRPRDIPWFTSELRYLIRKRNSFLQIIR